MNKHYLARGLVALIAVAGIALPAIAEPPPPTNVEHHLFLHLIPPEDAGSFTIKVVDRSDLIPEVEKEWLEPVDADQVPDTAPEEASLPPAEEDELEVLIEAALDQAEDVAEEAALLIMDEALLTTDRAEDAEVSLVMDAEEPGTPMGLLLFIFVLAIFLGFELISKVPSQLHTPLMSGSNAISGITIVGALDAAGLGLGGPFGTLLGILAVTFATINVVGGYMVTNRMLAMFKKKDGGAQ